MAQMIIVLMQVRATLDYKMSFQRLKKKSFFLFLYYTSIEVLLYVISSVFVCLGWCNNIHYAWLINQHLSKPGGRGQRSRYELIWFLVI